MDTIEDEDKERHPNVESYEYFVCGLKIGDEDYTVKAVVSNMNDGSRYYDHKLTKIEKGALIDYIKKTPESSVSISRQTLDPSVSDRKDKRLFSILQTNEPEISYSGRKKNGEEEKTKEYHTRLKSKSMDQAVQSSTLSGTKVEINPENRKGIEENLSDLHRKVSDEAEDAETFLVSLRKSMKTDSEDRSGYNTQTINGKLYTLRISDHFPDTRHLLKNNENDATGITVVISVDNRGRFRADDDAKMIEYVFNGDDLNAEKQRRIVEAIQEWMETGHTTIDFADYVHKSPKEITRAELERNKEYEEAVNNGDMEKAKDMLAKEAHRKNYFETSDYQGKSAFNGAAPSAHEYYDTPKESLEAWENEEYEGSWSIADELVRGIKMGDLVNRITARDLARGNQFQRESIQALREAMNKVQNGEKNPTVKVYRSVPKGVREGSVRNGDWVTLSKSYAIDNAEIHFGSKYYGKDGMVDWGKKDYNIIEMEVPIEDLWWDGNDINEFGYDNGKEMVYRNTTNNAKLLEPTYDNEGNLIPLSERFNKNRDDVRFMDAEKIGFDVEKYDKEHDSEFGQFLEYFRDRKNDKNPVKRHFVFGDTGDVLHQYGMTGKITIDKYVFNNRHSLDAHELNESDWINVALSINDPVAILKYKNRENSFRLYTTAVVNGQNICVGVDVNRVGYNLDVTNIRTAFGREPSRIVNSDEELLYSDENKIKQILNQFSVAPNSRLYGQESVSGGKDKVFFVIDQINLAKNADATENFASQFKNADIAVIRSADELDQLDIPESWKEQVKNGKAGFYDLQGKKSYVYMPNVADEAVGRKAVMHEAVAHYGLRELIGHDRYDSEMLHLLSQLPSEVKKEVLERAHKMQQNPMDLVDFAQNRDKYRAAAMDEYLADHARDSETPQWWSKVKGAVRNLLRNLGFDMELTDGDVKYMLWRSAENLRGNRGLVDAVLDKAMRLRYGVDAAAWRQHTEQGFRGMDMEEPVRWEDEPEASYQFRLKRWKKKMAEQAAETVETKQPTSAWMDSPTLTDDFAVAGEMDLDAAAKAPGIPHIEEEEVLASDSRERVDAARREVEAFKADRRAAEMIRSSEPIHRSIKERWDADKPKRSKEHQRMKAQFTRSYNAAMKNRQEWRRKWNDIAAGFGADGGKVEIPEELKTIPELPIMPDEPNLFSGLGDLWFGGLVAYANG